MSQYLNNLKLGETIDVRGPSGKLTYLGNGKLSVKNLRNEPPTVLNATHINMIAGKFRRFVINLSTGIIL